MANSPGWKLERAELDPDAGAVDVDAEAGSDGQQEQEGAAEEQRPLVAGEVGGALDEEQRRDERGDRDQAPQRLERGEFVVEAGDHDVADAVEQHGQRQHGAVGAAGQQADGDVGDADEHEQDAEERADPSRDLGVRSQ